MSTSSVFKMFFLADDKGSLSRMRNVIKGVGEQSYKTVDALSRSVTKLEKSMGRSMDRLSMLAGGGGILTNVFRSLNYSIIQSNSLITTNRILLEEIIGNKGKATEMVNAVQEVAGSFGQDVNEMMTAGRGLGQVMRAIDKNFKSTQLERMLKLVSVVSSLDTENRGLGYTSFSFKEALQGLGSGDWRSMRNRLEINLGKSYEKAITNAVKRGNMEQVVTLFEKAFQSIGINSGRIMSRLMQEGLSQNLARSYSYFNRIFQMLGSGAFKSFTLPLSKMNDFLSKEFQKDSTFMKKLEEISDSIERNIVKPSMLGLINYGRAVFEDKERFGSKFLEVVKEVTKAVKSVVRLPIEFAKGLFGFKELMTLEESVNNLYRRFEAIKSISSTISNIFGGFKEPIYQLGQSINNLVVSLLKLSNIGSKGGTNTQEGLGSLLALPIRMASGGINIASGGLDKLSTASSSFGTNDALGILSTLLLFGGAFKFGKNKFLSKFGKNKGANLSSIPNSQLGSSELGKNVSRSGRYDSFAPKGSKFGRDLEYNAKLRNTKISQDVSRLDEMILNTNNRIKEYQGKLNKSGRLNSLFTNSKEDYKQNIRDARIIRGLLEKKEASAKNSYYIKNGQVVYKYKKDIEDLKNLEKKLRDDRIRLIKKKNNFDREDLNSKLENELSNYGSLTRERQRFRKRFTKNERLADVNSKRTGFGIGDIFTNLFSKENFGSTALTLATLGQTAFMAKDMLKSFSSQVFTTALRMSPLIGGLIALTTAVGFIAKSYIDEYNAKELLNKQKAREELDKKLAYSRRDLAIAESGFKPKAISELMKNTDITDKAIQYKVLEDLFTNKGLKKSGGVSYQFVQMIKDITNQQKAGVSDESIQGQYGNRSGLVNSSFYEQLINMDKFVQTATPKQIEQMKNELRKNQKYFFSAKTEGGLSPYAMDQVLGVIQGFKEQQ